MLRLANICKSFAGVVACDNVSLEVAAGEIHALLGENGAGKSTLMNILYGLYRPDSGEIFVEGKRVEIDSPKEAIDCGIGMIHQHFLLAPALTVLENIILGSPPQKGPFLDFDAARQKLDEMSEKFGLAVDPTAEVGGLSVGVQQRVEILKALYRQVKILILDEPTGVLTPPEIHDLFGIIRGLAAQGYAVIFVTHKLEEVTEVADRATVLRQGRNIATVNCRETTPRDLGRLMVGRDVVLNTTKTPARIGSAVLSIDNLRVDNDQDIAVVRGVSLDVHAGEVVGIAGVDGNGQTELIEAIAGLRPVREGEIRLKGADITSMTIAERSDRGIGHIAEDRHRRGLVLEFDHTRNLILREFDQKPNSRFGFLQERVIQDGAAQKAREYDVRGARLNLPVKYLSGGNQQKIVLAREISREPSLLLAAKPTRGLDIGAIEFVRSRLVQERDKGMAILLVSSDLEEIVALSDRILVFFQGAVVGEMEGSAADMELLGAMMGGAKTLPAESRP